MSERKGSRELRERQRGGRVIQPCIFTQESDSGSDSAVDEEATTNAENNDEESEVSDADDDWKPEKPVFETKTRETHPVHSPQFPGGPCSLYLPNK